MFQWDKSINALNIPASKVVHLFRSMRELQLALPGVSAQQASAFLCQYQVEGGVCTVTVFHLQKSQALAFYVSDPPVVPDQKTDSMLDQGLNFVESMGFLMTDQDIHLLDEADQEMLWTSLPINSGLADEEKSSSVAAPVKDLDDKPTEKVKAPENKIVAAEKKETSVKKVESKAVKKEVPVVEPEEMTKKPEEMAKKDEPEAETETVENVDDLLAAVEAMRAKRPGLRARKSPPSEEEMARRRLQLRETVGRIWASL